MYTSYLPASPQKHSLTARRGQASPGDHDDGFVVFEKIGQLGEGGLHAADAAAVAARANSTHVVSRSQFFVAQIFKPGLLASGPRP